MIVWYYFWNFTRIIRFFINGIDSYFRIRYGRSFCFICRFFRYLWWCFLPSGQEWLVLFFSFRYKCPQDSNWYISVINLVIINLRLSWMNGLLNSSFHQVKRKITKESIQAQTLGESCKIVISDASKLLSSGRIFNYISKKWPKFQLHKLMARFYFHLLKEWLLMICNMSKLCMD